MSTDDKKQAAAEAAAALEQTLDKAKEVAAEIRQAADHLAVVNTVLGEQLPDEVQVGEVAQALEHGDTIEQQLSDSVDRLEEAHEELSQQAAQVGAAVPPRGGRSG